MRTDVVRLGGGLFRGDEKGHRMRSNAQLGFGTIIAYGDGPPEFGTGLGYQVNAGGGLAIDVSCRNLP